MMSKNRFSCPLRDWPVSQANAFCVIVRWPSLETGRNSVMPCTTPRISDSSHSIEIPDLRCDARGRSAVTLRVTRCAAQRGHRAIRVARAAVDGQGDGQPGEHVADPEQPQSAERSTAERQQDGRDRAGTGRSS